MRIVLAALGLSLAASHASAQCRPAWRGSSLVDQVAEWIPSSGRFTPVFRTAPAPLPSPAAVAILSVDSAGHVDMRQARIVAPTPVADSIRAEVATWRFKPATFRQCPVGSEVRAAIVRTGDTTVRRRTSARGAAPALDSAEAFVRTLLVRLSTGEWKAATAMFDSASLVDMHARTALFVAMYARDDSLPESPVRPIPAPVRERIGNFATIDSARVANRAGLELRGVRGRVTLGDFMRMPPRAGMELALAAQWRDAAANGPLEVVGSFLANDSVAHVLVEQVGMPYRSDAELRRRGRGWVARVAAPFYDDIAGMRLWDGPSGVFDRPTPVRARPMVTPRAAGVPCDTGALQAEDVDSTPRWIPSASPFRPVTDGSRVGSESLGLLQLTIDSLGIPRAGTSFTHLLDPRAPDDSIRAAAQAWRFVPASLNGCRVAVSVRVPLLRNVVPVAAAAARPAVPPEPANDPAAVVLAYHAALARREFALAAGYLDPESLRELRDTGVRILVNWFLRDTTAALAGAPLSRKNLSWTARGVLDRAAFERFRQVPLPNFAPGATLASLAGMPPVQVADVLLSKGTQAGTALIPVIRGVAAESDTLVHVLGWFTTRGGDPDDPWPTAVFHVVRRDGRWLLHGGSPVLSSGRFLFDGPKVEPLR